MAGPVDILILNRECSTAGVSWKDLTALFPDDRTSPWHCHYPTLHNNHFFQSSFFLVHLKILNLNVNPIGHRNRSHDKTESIVFYIRDLYHLHNSCLHSTLFILGSSGVIFKPAGHPFVCPQNKSLCCSFHLHIFYSFCQETAEQIDQL